MSAVMPPATEEYLQAVYTLGDEGGRVIAARLAEFLGVSPAAVSEMVHRMERDGLLSIDEHKSIGFTPSGTRAAASIVRRHRLAERMLVDLLGYDWWKTHEEAERIEHAMSDEMERRLIRVLGNPETCPHGNPMPGVKPRATRTLESLRPGESSPVERIPDQFEHEPGFLEYLDGVGIKPQVRVTLVAVDERGLRIAIDGQERGVRRDCGHKVLVAA